MKIIVVVPFVNAEKETAVWANEEDRIDFRHEHERAARCTTAFAAVELKSFLERSVSCVTVSFESGRPMNSVFIELKIR